MMKKWVFLFAVLVSACSFAVEVPAMPPSEHADTEVSTNFTCAIADGGGRRLVFALELAASPTKKLRM